MIGAIYFKLMREGGNECSDPAEGLASSNSMVNSLYPEGRTGIVTIVCLTCGSSLRSGGWETYWKVKERGELHSGCRGECEPRKVKECH